MQQRSGSNTYQMTKIISLEEAGRISEKAKSEGKSVVQCHGVFDLLHIGHLRHIKEAKKFGDMLIITITADKHVNKGPDRPAFPDKLRAEFLESLHHVDYVVINEHSTAIEAITTIKPNYYIKGSDYKNSEEDITGKITDEEKTVKEFGGEIKFTEDITFSSSNLINKYLDIIPETAKAYLKEFSKKYNAEDIINYLEKIKDMKILIIGEAIIDEYLYGHPLGKAGKESIIALRYKKKEKFAGGSLAIANHLSDFCDNVSLLATIGDKSSQGEFIINKLNPKIKKHLFKKNNSPTIVKRRFIDDSNLSIDKLFEMYVINDEPLSNKQTEELNTELEKILPEQDLVIVADFGHGMLNPKLIKTICDKSKFLAVNTQTNAGNRGYNTISKYPKMDYMCVDEPEIRLDSRNKDSELKDILPPTAKKLSCKNAVITGGNRGCNIISDNGKTEVQNIPIFSGTVLDTMGAGDAFLSITAPLAAKKTPSEIIGFIGNAVGAMYVRVMGNKK